MRENHVRFVDIDGRGYVIHSRDDGGWGIPVEEFVVRRSKQLGDSCFTVSKKLPNKGMRAISSEMRLPGYGVASILP